MIDNTKLKKEVIWSFASKGIVFVLYIGINAYLARMLGAENYGAWSFFYSILSIIFIISYSGINSSTRKFVAQHNHTEHLKPVLKSSFSLRVWLSLAFTILYVIVYKPLATVLGRSDLEPLFLAATPLIFLSGVVEYLKNIFQGLHRLKYNFIVSVMETGLNFILILAFLTFVNGTIAIVYSYNITLLFTSLTGFYLLYSRFYQPMATSSKDFRKEILRYSLPLFINNVGIIILAETGTIMLGLMSSDTEVGIYSAAKQIISKLPHIALAISFGTMPVFAKLDDENKAQLKLLFNKLLRINVFVFGILGILLLSTGWLIIPFIFGNEYRAAVLPMNILTFYFIGYSILLMLNPFLDYQGMARKRAINISISLILNILLNLILIPLYGATGVAIASLISYIPYVILNWIEVKKVL